MTSRLPTVRRRQLAILFSGLSLWLLACAVYGQSADDFFHSGAQSYLTNNVALARTNVDAGLKLYPGDEKLKKLDELLKQQQQQQQQQDQQNQQDQKDQQSQDQKNQDQKNQQSKNDQKKDQQNKPGQDKKDDKQKQDQDKQQPKSGDKNKDKGGKDKKEQPQQAQAKAVPAGQMTPQQAERLLDSQKGNEQVLWFKPDDKKKDEHRPVKDW